MCLYPKFIKNKKYSSTKKNGGIIPPVTDMRVLYVPTKCGKCIECRKQKQRDMQVRLQEDIKRNINGKFITLTFNNKSYQEINTKSITACNSNKKIQLPIQNIKGYAKDNAIATWAIRHFLERWRKQYKKSLRHWLVTELGHNGTENIHLHGIIWTDIDVKTVAEIWQYGYIWPRESWKGNYVNAQTINYITKYVSKQDFDHPNYIPIILSSPGIGSNYTKSYNATKNKFKEENTNETYKTNTGHNISLPIYYRNKIYNDQEKEKLWLQKLNKQERYILGAKIDVSKNYDEYFKALHYARQQNKELGYCDDTKDWIKNEQEQYRRNLKQLQRLTPSAGSLAKGFGLINTPPTNEETSHVERGISQTLTRKGVSPAAGCERIHILLNNIVDKIQWNVEKQIWEIK